MLTLKEVAEKLAEQYDEVDILEILEINSFDLVKRFEDKIERKQDDLRRLLDADDSMADDEHNSGNMGGY